MWYETPTKNKWFQRLAISPPYLDKSPTSSARTSIKALKPSPLRINKHLDLNSLEITPPKQAFRAYRQLQLSSVANTPSLSNADRQYQFSNASSTRSPLFCRFVVITQGLTLQSDSSTLRSITCRICGYASRAPGCCRPSDLRRSKIARRIDTSKGLQALVQIRRLAPPICRRGSSS